MYTEYLSFRPKSPYIPETLRDGLVVGRLIPNHRQPTESCQLRWLWVTLKGVSPHVCSYHSTNSDQILNGNPQGEGRVIMGQREQGTSVPKFWNPLPTITPIDLERPNRHAIIRLHVGVRVQDRRCPRNLRGVLQFPNIFGPMQGMTYRATGFRKVTKLCMTSYFLQGYRMPPVPRGAKNLCDLFIFSFCYISFLLSNNLSITIIVCWLIL